MIDIGLYFGYTLLIVAAAAAIVLPLINAVKSPAGIIKSLYGIVAILVLFGIAYAISDNSVKPTWAVYGITPGLSKVIGAGLILFYITLFVAVLGLIYSEINKTLK